MSTHLLTAIAAITSGRDFKNLVAGAKAECGDKGHRFATSYATLAKALRSHKKNNSGDDAGLTALVEDFVKLFADKELLAALIANCKSAYVHYVVGMQPSVHADLVRGISMLQTISTTVKKSDAFAYPKQFMLSMAESLASASAEMKAKHLSHEFRDLAACAKLKCELDAYASTLALMDDIHKKALSLVARIAHSRKSTTLTYDEMRVSTLSTIDMMIAISRAYVEYSKATNFKNVERMIGSACGPAFIAHHSKMLLCLLRFSRAGGS